MELIFRQWDDKFCRFTYWGVNIPMVMYCQTVGTTPFEGQENRLRQAFTTPSKEGVNSEQYTGINDKNGKMIFEGDILKIHAEKQYIEEFGDTVTIKKGAWDMSDDYGTYFVGFEFPYCGDGKHLEVIGHIHKEAI